MTKCSFKISFSLSFIIHLSSLKYMGSSFKYMYFKNKFKDKICYKIIPFLKEKRSKKYEDNIKDALSE